MRIPGRALLIGSLAALAGCAVWLAWPHLDATQSPALASERHRPLHIGCPPGSHGRPRHANFGRSLGYDPMVQTPHAMASRTLTAGRRGGQGP